MGDTTAGERAPLIAPVINEHLMGTRGATRVRLVHVSDTHGRHHRYAGTIPGASLARSLARRSIDPCSSLAGSLSLLSSNALEAGVWQTATS